MDKLGVVVEEDSAKTASAEGRPCPQCGTRKVNYTGLTPQCPNCGVEPWEPHERRNGRGRVSQR